MKKLSTSIVIVSAILLVFATSAFAYRDIIDLGALGGASGQAYSINNSNQIVGYAADSHNWGRACLFNPADVSSNKNLGTAGSYSSHSYAFSISNDGRIVGYVSNSSGYGRACLFDSTGGGTNKILGTLSGYTSSAARSINNNNQIVGESSNSSTTHACLFDSTGLGRNIDLGTFGDDSFAHFINNNGKIVGGSNKTPTTSVHACLFDPTGGGANKDLGTLGGTYSDALYINDVDQIVGVSRNSSGYYRACLFSITNPSLNVDLGGVGANLYSMALSINNIGQIVGYADDGFSTDSRRACLFDPTGWGNNIDLNTLINPSSSWILKEAYGINDNGWIVGWGTNSSGFYRAFLLTPEPATILLFTLGGVILRRKK